MFSLQDNLNGGELDGENTSDTHRVVRRRDPTKLENALSTKVTLEEEAILVEHARPYAYLQTGAIYSPPC